MLQMFSMHSFTLMEAGVLLAMSVDRFVAIRRPLRCTTILTISRISGMGVTIALRRVTLMVPLLLLLKHLPFCGHNVPTHSYCLHSDLIKLPCGDTRPNSILGLSVISFTFGLDSLFIAISHVLALHTVMGVASGTGRWGALNTCVSLISAVLVDHVSMVSLSLLHRFGQHSPLLLQMAMANIYFFFPLWSTPLSTASKPRKFTTALLVHCLERWVRYLRGFPENTGTWIKLYCLDISLAKGEIPQSLIAYE